MSATRDQQSDNFLNSDALSDEFFIEIIERKLSVSRDKFKVRLVMISPATGKNENYVSVVYRAKVNVEIIESKQRQFVEVIIKVMLSNLPELKEWSVFPREIFMYNDILTSYEKIWKEKTDESVVFGPKCLKVSNEPYEVVVLDDLKAEGYQMLNRKIGVDAHQAKLVLSKLAKLHATSVVRHQNESEVNKHLDRESYRLLFSTESQFYPWYCNAMNSFTSIVKSLEGFEEISTKISKLTPEQMMFAYFQPGNAMKNGFKVLNHGDDWLNNMMFKINSEGVTEDVKLLDFQISYFGSPSGDLLYFILTSVNDEVKINNFDGLIAHYYSELIESFNKLGYDGQISSLNEIHEDFLEKKEYALSILLDVMFVCKYDSSDELTMEQFTDPTILTEKKMRSYYENANYLNALKLWLIFFNERNLLNY